MKFDILLSSLAMISVKMRYDDREKFPLNILPRGEYEKAVKIGKEMMVEGLMPEDSRVPNNLRLAISMAILIRKERRNDLYKELTQEPGHLMRSDFLRKLGTLGFFVFYDVIADHHTLARRRLNIITKEERRV